MLGLVSGNANEARLEGEMVDRTSLALPGAQAELLANARWR